MKKVFEEFIQLLHDGRHHQVIISTVDSQPGEVKYYEYYKSNMLYNTVQGGKY